MKQNAAGIFRWNTIKNMESLPKHLFKSVEEIMNSTAIADVRRKEYDHVSSPVTILKSG
jgi:hypothetical protein